jgi:hypothetical protein
MLPLSVLPLLPLLPLPLSAHPPALPPASRLFFLHSPPPLSPSSGGFLLAWPVLLFISCLSHDPQSTGLAPVSTKGGSVQKAKVEIWKVESRNGEI